MSEPTLNPLTQRLDRLERENRRLKIAGAIVLLAVVAVGAMGQVLPKAVPKVLEAERFVLRDTSGKILATLGPSPLGPGLSLYDQSGKIGASLLATLGPNLFGPGLSLFDQSGKIGASLVLLAGTPTLNFNDQNGKARAGRAEPSPPR
jgi:hypothetical protein